MTLQSKGIADNLFFYYFPLYFVMQKKPCTVLAEGVIFEQNFFCTICVLIFVTQKVAAFFKILKTGFCEPIKTKKTKLEFEKF